MRRISFQAWMLIVAVIVTVAVNVVSPAVGLFFAIGLALLVWGVVATGGGPGGAGEATDLSAHERKGEVLRQMLGRGRPKWQRTPPDHADEPPDLIWARERERRRGP